MDSFELNKIAGAVLATGLLIMALSITSEIIYLPEDLRESGYVIAVDETEDTDAAPGALEEQPIAVRLQTADVSAGEAAARKCQACHTFQEGEPAKVGPNLYGIVAAEAAHVPGFRYSSAMMDKNAEGMVWSYEELDQFLANPKAEVPGTIMAFAGIRRPEERADVIAYLRTLSDDPLPLPEPPAAAEPDETAADGAPDADNGEGMSATPEGTAPAATGNAAEAGEPPAASTTESAPDADSSEPSAPVPEETPPAAQ